MGDNGKRTREEGEARDFETKRADLEDRFARLLGDDGPLKRKPTPTPAAPTLTAEERADLTAKAEARLAEIRRRHADGHGSIQTVNPPDKCAMCLAGRPAEPIGGPSKTHLHVLRCDTCDLLAERDRLEAALAAERQAHEHTLYTLGVVAVERDEADRLARQAAADLDADCTAHARAQALAGALAEIARVVWGRDSMVSGVRKRVATIADEALNPTAPAPRALATPPAPCPRPIGAARTAHAGVAAGPGGGDEGAGNDRAPTEVTDDE